MATVLFLGQTYLGLGLGGMERVAAFPAPLAACALGVVLLTSSTSRTRKTRASR